MQIAIVISSMLTAVVALQVTDTGPVLFPPVAPAKCSKAVAPLLPLMSKEQAKDSEAKLKNSFKRTTHRFPAACTQKSQILRALVRDTTTTPTTTNVPQPSLAVEPARMERATTEEFHRRNKRELNDYLWQEIVGDCVKSIYFGELVRAQPAFYDPSLPEWYTLYQPNQYFHTVHCQPLNEYTCCACEADYTVQNALVKLDDGRVQNRLIQLPTCCLQTE